jgi:hypothetical protein
MARTPFKLRSSGPFKMMGSSPMRIDPKKKKEEVLKVSGKDELVSYTDSNYQPDWASSPVTPYETKISKATQRLINAGAPKDVIEKSMQKTIDRSKKRKI